MFAQMMASSGGGSNIKSGTSPALTAAQQTITIDTGLSQINKFVWCAKVSGNPRMNYDFYDRDLGEDKFSYGVTAGYQGQYNIAIPSPSSNIVYGDQIVGINGGVVSIKSGSTYGLADAGYWCAE